MLNLLHAPTAQVPPGRIRKRADLEDVRMHDLRHTTGTVAGATGANAFMVRDLLGHKNLAMTGRYVNRDAYPQRALVEEVASQLDAAKGLFC